MRRRKKSQTGAARIERHDEGRRRRRFSPDMIVMTFGRENGAVMTRDSARPEAEIREARVEGLPLHRPCRRLSRTGWPISSLGGVKADPVAGNPAQHRPRWCKARPIAKARCGAARITDHSERSGGIAKDGAFREEHDGHTPRDAV